MTDKYRLVCCECQYTIEVDYEEIADYNKCPICKGIMAYDMATEKITREDFVDRIIINQMEKEIKILGNQKCYSVIQNLSEPRVRTRYLDYFIRAGGFVPKSDLIIEKEGNFFLKDREGKKENEKS